MVNQIDKSKLGKIVPALYVSKFDPSTPVRDVMKVLWDKLVEQEDKAALFKLHSDAIIQFALSQTSSRFEYKCNNLYFIYILFYFDEIIFLTRAWRDRETGSSALEMFISQRPWSEIIPHLPALWFAGAYRMLCIFSDIFNLISESGMQVLDDVRDSTRIAAVGFTKVLAQSIVRACTPEEIITDSEAQYHETEGSVTTDALKSWRSREESKMKKIADRIDCTAAIIVPIILDKGLVAASVEGRGFSLGVLVQLVKVTFSCQHIVLLIFNCI